MGGVVIHVKKSIYNEFISRYDFPGEFITDRITDGVVVVVDEFVKVPYVCTHGEQMGVLFLNLDDFEDIFSILNDSYLRERKSPKGFIEKVMQKLLIG